MGAVGREMLPQAVVEGVQIALRKYSARNAPLIGDDDGLASRTVKAGNGFFHAGQHFDLLPRGYITSDSFPVQHAVPI